MTESPARRAELLLDGLSFPEAPRWRDGRLWFSDFHTHRVLTVTPDGVAKTICDVPAKPSGLGWTPDGDLLVVSVLDSRVWRLRDGELEEYAALGELATLANDMLVDDAGRAYVGNFGSDVNVDPIVATTLARVDPDGSVHLAAEGLVFPNGMAFLPDGRTFVVAETFAYCITAFDYDPADGALSNRRVWADFGDGTPAPDIPAVLADRRISPDGICVDAEGAIWVASATTPGIQRVREGGEVLDEVDTGGLAVFAAALGGEDGRTLYLCAGPPLGEADPTRTLLGAILTCRVDVPAIGH